MSEQAVAGVVLIAVPILFIAGFTMLAQRFDYPNVLRRPTDEVLERFRAGGATLNLIWWAFALSAVLFAALASCSRSRSRTRIGPWSSSGRWSSCSPRWCNSWV